MMEKHKKGIYPTGLKDGYEHDGLVAFIPLIIQQSPDLGNLLRGIGYKTVRICLLTYALYSVTQVLQMNKRDKIAVFELNIAFFCDFFTMCNFFGNLFYAFELK